MHDLDPWHMRRALELARRGEGRVEPNPMVGAVVVHGAEIIGEGFHRLFGGPHAEVEALLIAGRRAAGATLYVTLEPCCHQGKTPPCTEAILAAGIRRVVVAHGDPFPAVDGGGLAQLRAAGVEVTLGVLEPEARALLAPYLKLVTRGRPWVIAKWAMTLDGRIATCTGESQWISREPSRQIVHELRGRVDAILVGRGTAVADDPRLTARPAGPRVATRIVLDTTASLSPASQLWTTARETPLVVACGESAPEQRRRALTEAGAEPLVCPGADPAVRLAFLLDECGRRRWTNLLVEGGAATLGSLLELREIDEVHAFLSPRLVGGATSLGPVGGRGIEKLADALRLEDCTTREVGGDLYVTGRVER